MWAHIFQTRFGQTKDCVSTFLCILSKSNSIADSNQLLHSRKVSRLCHKIIFAGAKENS
jgi:hypothetical protein